MTDSRASKWQTRPWPPGADGQRRRKGYGNDRPALQGHAADQVPGRQVQAESEPGHDGGVPVRPCCVGVRPAAVGAQSGWRRISMLAT